jgi:hypothetical protein
MGARTNADNIILWVTCGECDHGAEDVLYVNQDGGKGTNDGNVNAGARKQAGRMQG